MRCYYSNGANVFLFFGLTAFDPEQIDKIIYSVYSTFHNLPNIDQMYLDNRFYDGLFYWYDGCKIISEEIENRTKIKK